MLTSIGLEPSRVGRVPIQAELKAALGHRRHGPLRPRRRRAVDPQRLRRAEADDADVAAAAHDKAAVVVRKPNRHRTLPALAG